MTFLELVEQLGRAETFFLYAVATVAAFIFTWSLVRETKGRSLEEIEADLRQPQPA